MLYFLILALLSLASSTVAQQVLYGQCGGIGWTGATTCVSGASCIFLNDYYFQCLPSSAAVSSPAASKTTTKTQTTTTQTSSNNCQATADGFASLNGGTTGGNGGTVVTVSTQADLERYAAASGKYVIKIKGRINMSPKGKEVSVASDKTIVGIGSTGEIYGGGFHLINVKNIIIRNLKIGNTYVEGDWDGKTQDFDGIQMDTCSNIWIDHCTFEKGGDGLIDSRKDTTFLTVSNCILRDHNKAFGIGWTENLTAQMTIHHNWFSNTSTRNPSTDNVLRAHLYNNYLSNTAGYGHYSRGMTSMRMENVYFDKVKNPITMDAGASLYATGTICSGCTGTRASNSGTVFDPKSFYSYRLDATADVPTIVKANAGVKASLCPS